MIDQIKMKELATFTNKKIEVTKPKIEDIDIKDISHSLSMMCRYNGHCKYFYSIAEHSVLVMNIVRKLDKYASKDTLMLALMHDAHECYISDMPKPVKDVLTGITSIERIYDKVIFEKFGIKDPDYKIVKLADFLALLREKKAILTTDIDFGSELDVVLVPEENIYCYSFAEAEQKFLEAYEEILNLN